MKILEEIEFKQPPRMFAAWPGMGNVGIVAVDYLRNKLNGKPFAEIDMASFFIPDSIIVKEGIAQLPEIPGAVFYYTTEPSAIFFESSAQVGGKEGITIIKKILDIAEKYNVSQIYTAAAYAQPMSHNSPSKVLYACNDPSFFDQVGDLQIEPMPDGYIAGQNGLLLGIAATRSIKSSCFLGTIPTFATNLTYPKASLELVKIFEKVLNLTIDYADLIENIKVIDQQLAAIEERIKEYFPSIMEKEDEDIPEMQEEEVPHYIMDKIERMFDEVKKDKSKAQDLKSELDRWNLYELYEHRFLNLFKEDDRESKRDK